MTQANQIPEEHTGRGRLRRVRMEGAMLYTIATIQERPSMSLDCTTQDYPSYAAAVQASQAAWLRTRRTTTLHSGPHAIYWWHRIRSDGVEMDRNHNSTWRRMEYQSATPRKGQGYE